MFRLHLQFASIFQVIWFCFSWNDRTVSSFLNLMENERNKSESFQLPTNNEYFLNGSNNNDNATIDFGTYDFIVVGAGTSGSTLAYSLSENPNWNVLLLEAGGNYTEFSEIPSQLFFLFNSPLNWGYFTTPQEHACRGMSDFKCTYPRGKVLGGTGGINALMYVRGNKEDYNSWSEGGAKGWSYEEVLRYFKDQETSKVQGDKSFRGTNGPISVEYPQSHSPIMRYFFEANEAIGRKILDYNGKDQIGAARTQFTIKGGRRESGATVFLDKAAFRKNLKVVQKALVTKVAIDGTKRACGVDFVKSGDFYSAKAAKEVILSAGTVNTPQILMLSGIGHKEKLTEFGIKVIKDIPELGRNFQDHPSFMGLAFSTNLTVHSLSETEVVKQFLDGYGAYTVPGSAYGSIFIRHKTSKLPAGVPDIQVIFIAPNSTSAVEPKAMNIKEEISSNYWNRIPPESSFRTYLLLLHPKSTGSITLTSNSPFDFPLINPNFLKEEEDRESLYEGIKAFLELTESEPFRRINATFIDPEISECNQSEHNSKEFWYCIMKYLTGSMFHPTSTAAIGKVVDDRLRVFGIDGLRVVDCSVMPSITSGNTNAPAFMIGGKAADIIKEDYKEVKKQ